MATGVYGINIPSDITSNDVEIFYSYSSDRTSTNTEDATFTKLNSNILVKAKKDADSGVTVSGDTTLEGMYQLKLPTNYFSQSGYYTVYIKPKEISAVISDVSVLAAYPDVRGIVIDSNTIEDANIKTLFQENNGMVGYRVIYYNDNGERMNYYRIVTSNFRAEPIIQNLSNSNEKSVRYTYNDSGTLIFLTLTPSSSPSFKPNANPFIGKTSEQVLFVNTSFNPISLEIEMTNYNEETISNMLEGTQIRDLDHGLITTLNNNNEIYHQSENYQLKNTTTGKPVYEIHKKKTNIDYTQTLDNIENA